MKYITYKTKKEEKLKELAEQFQTSPELIKKANPKAKIFTSFPWGYEVVSYDEILKIPVPDESTIEDETHSFKTDEFIPIARYRCSQQNSTRALSEVRFSAEIKSEYLLSKLEKDKTYYHVGLKDYVYLVHPNEMGSFFDLAREVEFVRNNVQFSQEEKEKITIHNISEILTNWEHCKNEIIPKLPFFKVMQEKDPSAAIDFLNKGDEEFLDEEKLVGILNANLFYHILWKMIANNLNSYNFVQPSQIFPKITLNINVNKTIISEKGNIKTYKLTGKWDKEKLPMEELINIYDEIYKPLLRFSFTEYDFIYNITYTVDTTKGILLEAIALVYEKIKNNFEVISQFKLETTEL